MCPPPHPSTLHRPAPRHNASPGWITMPRAPAQSVYQVGFRIVTLRTQHKLSDESIQHVLQLIRLVRSIDNVAVVLSVELSLGAQLTAKILGGIWKKGYRDGSEKTAVTIQTISSHEKFTLTRRRPIQCLRNINHVDYYRLDSISFAFHLSAQNRKGAQEESRSKPIQFSEI